MRYVIHMNVRNLYYTKRVGHRHWMTVQYVKHDCNVSRHDAFIHLFIHYFIYLFIYSLYNLFINLFIIFLISLFFL